MKNLLTLLLLVISLLASGQSNSQSIEVEIKYWKSIAESNDTVAYREYLQRYGEDGLFYDEALTRIALLKTTGKQALSNSIECCYYTQYPNCSDCVEYVVRFDAEQSKTWLKPINYDTVRSNLAVSREFYENQAVLSTSRESFDKKNTIVSGGRPVISSPYLDKREQYTPQTVRYSPDYYKYKYAWTTDEEYLYDPMKSTSARDVYCKQCELLEIQWHHRAAPETKKTFYRYPSDFSDPNSVLDIEKGRDGVYNLIQKYDNYLRYEIKKTMQGFRYVAFSKDKTSFIMWFEQDNNLDGVIREKKEYYKVPKEELLPKAVNYDFLNE